MQTGWLAAGVAFALAAAIVIVAVPRDPAVDDRIESSSFEAELEHAIAQVRDEGIAERPTWRVGDAWNVRFGDGDPVCWVVVVAEHEEGLDQGFWCETDEAPYIAVQVAVLDLPYLGRFTQDLEGRTQEGVTRWYDWPLEDGKSWTTTYREMDVEVKVALADDRFVLEMIDEDGEDLARYDYDPTQRWWSQISFDGFDMRIQGAQQGWDRPTTRAIATPEASGRSTEVANFDIGFEADEEDTHVVMALRNPPVARHVYQLTKPDGTAAESSLPGPSGTNLQFALNNPTDRFELFESQPGPWRFTQTGAGIGTFAVDLWTARLSIVTP